MDAKQQKGFRIMDTDRQRVMVKVAGQLRPCGFVCYASICGREQAIVIYSRDYGRAPMLYYCDPGDVRAVEFDAAGQRIIPDENPITGASPEVVRS